MAKRNIYLHRMNVCVFLADVVSHLCQPICRPICMDYILQIGNYSESSEINICLCLNYLDRFIMLCTRKLPVRPVIGTNIWFCLN